MPDFATNQPFQILPQITDAFSYNTIGYRPHKPYNYFCLQIERLDALRRAGAAGVYRLHDWVTPLNLTTVGALATNKTQLRLEPGSYIWAIVFCDVESAPISQGGLGTGLITDFNLTIADHDTGMEFFSSPVSGGISNYPLLQLLDEPRPVLGSGQIDVTFVNRINAARTPQLVIRAAEPCVLATEGA